MNRGPRNLEELHELASRPADDVVQAVADIEDDILVLGAGGKMGFHLSTMLRRALDRNQMTNRVIAISRFGDPQVRDRFHAAGIETVAIDLTAETAVDALPDASTVFYLAGVKFGSSGQPEMLQTINVDLPARVADRFSRASIVALSTGCVYAFDSPDRGGSVETDPLDPPGDYAISCVGRERSFVQANSKGSLIRLNYSVDLRYGVLVDLASHVLAGKPVNVETGHVNVIWQGDANRYIIRALEIAARPPVPINVTGARILSVREVAQRFADRFKKPLEIVGNEQPTAWLSNPSKSHELWGPPQVDEDTLIDWVGDWMLHGGETLNKPTHFETRDGQY